jgi:hypothetical protein
MHVSKKKRSARRLPAILAIVAAFIAGTFLVAAPAGATQQSNVTSSISMSANLAGAVTTTVNATMVTATTAYPTSSSVCAASVNQFGTPCVRIVENGLGHVYAYATFYEVNGRPSVASAVATVDICGYGTNGTCRDLGPTYVRSYDMTGVFGRTCSVDVAGGWSGIASGSCQIQGDNWNLTAGNLYQGVVTWKIVRYSDGAPFYYTVRTAWIQPKG